KMRMKMRKKVMRYIFIALILTALTCQVSCKSEDKPAEAVVKNEIAQAEIPAEAAVPVSEQDEEPRPEPVAAEVKAAETEVKKEPVKDIAQVKAEVKKAETVKVQAEKKPLDEKGVVSYVEGNVRKKSIEEQDFKTNVAEKSAVKSRESYKTMIKSRAELELSELDIIRLAPKTTVDLVALYEEAKDGKKKTDIKLEEGDLWAQVNSSDDNNEFMMDTDIAAAAITGTNFRMSKDGELTEMKVYHGEVKISNARERMDELKAVSVSEFRQPSQTLGPKQIEGPKQVSLEEWVYIVKNMQKISFDKSGKVVSAGEFKADDSDEKTSWVEWNKKRDRNKGLK
ncbi:MAG: FecR domain-containing protein, partial [Candidatus Delongbacteria bacterium]|nr:FecR domain-containing protein [Candidatus Delongbacteria bacterium]